MGSEKTSTTQQQTVKATPEETELNKLTLDRARAAQPGQIQAQQQGLSLINQLLTGGQLPGFLNSLPGGINENQVQSISQKAVQDIMPSFQSSGIIDSGVAASIAGRTAGDVRRSASEFNIGNLLNLLNLAVGGQAQIQQPLLGQSQQLSSSLAGLRSINGISTTQSMNPFMKSLQQGLGAAPGQFVGGLGGTSAAGKFFF